MNCDFSINAEKHTNYFVKRIDMPRVKKNALQQESENRVSAVSSVVDDEDYEEVDVSSHTLLEQPKKRVTHGATADRQTRVAPKSAYFAKDQEKQLRYILEKFDRPQEDALYPIKSRQGNSSGLDDMKTEDSGLTVLEDEFKCALGYFKIITTREGAPNTRKRIVNMRIAPMAGSESKKEMSFTLANSELINQVFSDFGNNTLYFYTLIGQSVVKVTGSSSRVADTEANLEVCLNCIDLNTGRLYTNLTCHEEPFLIGDRFSPEKTQQMLEGMFRLVHTAKRDNSEGSESRVYFSEMHQIVVIYGTSHQRSGHDTKCTERCSDSENVKSFVSVEMMAIESRYQRLVMITSEQLIVVDIVTSKVLSTRPIKEIKMASPLSLFALENGIVICTSGPYQGFASAGTGFGVSEKFRSLCRQSLVAIDYQNLEIFLEEGFVGSINSRLTKTGATVRLLDQQFGVLFEENPWISSERLSMQLFTLKKDSFVWSTSNLTHVIFSGPSGQELPRDHHLEIEDLDVCCNMTTKLNRKFQLKLKGTSTHLVPLQSATSNVNPLVKGKNHPQKSATGQKRIIQPALQSSSSSNHSKSHTFTLLVDIEI